MRHDTCNFRNTALAASALAFALSASAAVPVRWDADAYRVKTLVYDCYHGETLDLAATLTAYGDPIDLAGKTARLWWQTNGMDAAWWATNAEVRVDAATGATNVLAATWRGSFDTGADEVRGFIGVEGENYRAAFALRLRPSPGFAPSVLPIPVRTIDWGAVANERADLAPFALKGGAGGGVTATEATNIAARVVTNGVAPWALAGQARPVADLTAATNYTDSATGALSNATWAALATAAVAATNYTDAAIASIDRTKITDGTNAVYATLDATVSVPGRWNPQGYVVDGSTMYTNINWYSLPSGSGYWRRDVYTWMSGEWNLESTNTPMSDGEHPTATDPDATTLYFVRNDEASRTEYIPPTAVQTRIATTNDLIEANRYTDAATNALGAATAVLSNMTYNTFSALSMWLENETNAVYESIATLSNATITVGSNRGKSFSLGSIMLGFGGIEFDCGKIKKHVLVSPSMDFTPDWNWLKCNDYGLSDYIASTTNGLYSASSGNALAAQVSAIGTHLNAEDAKFVVTNYNSVTRMPEAYVEIKLPDQSWSRIWSEMTRFNWMTNAYLPTNYATKAEVEEKADRAWGYYDSHSGSYAPEGYTWISSPKIAIAADLAYQRIVTSAGNVWVLCSHGMVTETGGDTNGYFRISDNKGNTAFEIVAGEERLIGAPATNVTVAADTLTIEYPVNAKPTIEVCDSLTNHLWKAETDGDCIATVTWSGQAGAWIATVAAKQSPQPQMFVQASYKTGGETIVRNSAPVSLTHVYIGGTKYAVGTASVGGHTVMTLTPAN